VNGIRRACAAPWIAGWLLGSALLLSAPAHAQVSAPVAPAMGQLGLHIVQPGESLFTIAARYGMQVTDLTRLNGTRFGAPLMPGRGLWVPLAKALPVARADAAAGANAPASTGAAVDSPAMDLPPEPADPAREAATRTAHTVVAGDTLSSIAQQYGVTAGHLMRLNDIAEGDYLQLGQVLVVPAPGAGIVAAEARSASVGGGDGKRIEIDISDQRMYVWQGDTLVWNLVASTGMNGYPTRRGTFAVQSKIDNAWSSAWQLWMPNWLGIYWAGGSENGIHALPIINGQRLWGGYLGTPISYGCIVLDTVDAAMLYDWAEIGTKVVIRD
jgi:LysM repeat protein